MDNDATENRPHRPNGPHLWEIRAVRDLLWLLGGACLIWLLSLLQHIVLPIFTGLLLAYLVHPLITWVKKTCRIPSVVTIGLIFMLFFLVVTTAGVWLGPMLKEQALALVDKVPDYLDRLSEQYGIQVDDLAQQFRSSEDDNGTPPVIIMAGDILGKTTEILLWIILVPIYFAFFSWHFQSLMQSGRRYLLLDRYPHLAETLQRMDDAVGTFFRARLFISFLVGVVFCVGWWLADVPFWFLLGVISGLLSTIPYLSIAGWFLVLIFKYLEMTGQQTSFDFMTVIFWPSLVFGIGNFLEAWVFTPWVHGRTTQLNPVMILTVVLIGGSLAGFWGLLLSIPVALCLNILYLEFRPPRLKG